MITGMSLLYKKAAFALAMTACLAIYADGTILTLEQAGTLSASLTAAGSSLSDLSSCTQLVVDCNGTIASDTSISDWTGDLRIKTGSIFNVTAVGGQGAASGKIFIENGGQFRVTYNTKNGFVQVKKTCYLEGEGPDGNGALYSACTVNQENGASVWPGELHLTGNAKWTATSSNGSQDIYGMLLDLNGHVLTFGVGGRFHNVIVTNGGHIVTIKNSMLIQGETRFYGDASNTLTFKGSGVARFWGNSGMSTPWTLIFDETSANYIYPGNGDNRWQGPVIVKGPVNMQRWNEWPSFAFVNVVSGAGGFQPRPNEGRNNHMKLILSNPGNTFKGGVEMNEGVLEVKANGALPADGNALKMKNGSVLLETADTLDLPPAVFSATGMVQNGIGTWRTSLTKKDVGTLLYRSRVGAPLLDVQGGSFMMSNLDKGLWETVVAGSDSGYQTAWSAHTVVSNYVAKIPQLFYKNINSGWKDYMYVGYSGYIWNRSDSPVVWTFGCCFDDNAKLYIGGTQILSVPNWEKPVFGQATLQPGPNKFELYGINWTGGAGGTGGKPVDGVTPWAQAKGIAYHVGATDSTSPADYTAFTGNDDLFTLTDGSNPDDISAIMPAFPNIRLEAGVILGVGGSTYRVDELEGLSASVVEGGLKIAEKWTLSAGDVNTNGVLSVAGTLKFVNGAVISVDEPSALVKVPFDNAYTIATASAVEGVPVPDAALSAKHWFVRVQGATVKLFNASGMTIYFR